MAIAVDDTTVARFTGTPTNGNPIASGSFTPPDGSLLVVPVHGDTGGGPDDITISVSGGSLSWTNEVERDPGDGGGANDGHASIWTAEVATGASMSVSVTRTAGNGGTNRLSAKVYIVTGHKVGDPVGAVGEGSSASTSNTPNAYTSTANNSRGFGCATDWGQNGNLTSSDVEDVADYAGAIAVISLYKAADTPTSGSTVTINFVTDGGGTSAWNWVAVEILADPGPPGGFRLLENGTDQRLLENGTDFRILEETEDEPPVELEGLATGRATARGSIDVAVGLSARAVGRASARAGASIATALASRSVGSARTLAQSAVARSLNANVSAGARTRSTASVARDLAARAAGSARTAAQASVARLLNASAVGRTGVVLAFDEAASIAGRIGAGARVLGSLVVARALEARTVGQGAVRAGQSVSYALSAVVSGRASTAAQSAVSRALSATVRAGAGTLAGAGVNRALSAIVRAGASVRANLPPLFEEVVGFVSTILRASMRVAKIVASMSVAPIVASAKTSPIVVSAVMIPKAITLKGYVIGDDTEIPFQLTDWPAGVLLAKAYLTIKKSLKDLDAAAIIQRDITTALTAEGQITADGSSGTAEGYFLIRHQDGEWPNVKPALDYHFDIQPITDQATLRTPIKGTISFQKGATDAVS